MLLTFYSNPWQKLHIFFMGCHKYRGRETCRLRFQTWPTSVFLVNHQSLNRVDQGVLGDVAVTV